VSNAIYGVFLGYCSCLWFTHIQWSFFARYGLRELQIYVQFFFKLLTNEILKTFLVRYKRLNSLLKTHLSYRRRLKNISKTIPLKLVRQTVTHMIFLRTTQEMFNDLFGWPLLLIVAYTTVQFLNAILFMFSDVPFSPSETFILLGGRFATITVVTVRMILLCDDVSREARKIFFASLPDPVALRGRFPKATEGVVRAHRSRWGKSSGVYGRRILPHREI
jgi:gustatory receptor